MKQKPSLARGVAFLSVLLGAFCPAEESKSSHFMEVPANDQGLPGSGPLRHADWFTNLWKQRRGEWANQVEKDQGAVVFLGDSITQGWGDSMGGNFKELKVANRGISGDTTRGMLIRLPGDVLQLKPRGVVMLMGTNDLEENAAPETIAANMGLILDELSKANASLPIIICEIFPSSSSKARPADKIKKANELIYNLAKDRKNVTVVDTWTLFADAQGDAKPAEFPDVLHPNELGYAKWAAALRPIFATLGWVETEAADFKLEDGYVSLINGKDLSGWGFRDGEGKIAESFDGKSLSSDGRYLVQNGKIIVTTPSTRSKLAQLYTTREFPKNFTLKLEFRASPNADSGVFLRKPQLQCRDYPLAGPYKTLTKYKAQDWNEMEVVVKANIAHCTCNGEVLEAALALAPTGPIGLEGDRGQMEYRRIRIKEDP